MCIHVISDLGVVWINGERIEYRDKKLVGDDTWNLRLIRRATSYTASTYHISGSIVWIEAGNILPESSKHNVWNATSVTGGPDLSSHIVYDEWVPSIIDVQTVPELQVAYQANSRVSRSGITYSSTSAILAINNTMFVESSWRIIVDDEYTRIDNVSPGGMWYANTTEARILHQSPGQAIY